MVIAEACGEGAFGEPLAATLWVVRWSVVCILIGWTTACGGRTPLLSGADSERDPSLGAVSGAGSTTCAWDLTPVQSYPANPSPDAIAAADLDGDGRIDVALGSPNDGSLAVLRNDGMGRFEPPVIYKGGQPSSVATGDFDPDGARRSFEVDGPEMVVG